MSRSINRPPSTQSMLEVRLATLIAIVLPSFLLLCHWLAAQSRTTHASPIAEECCRFAAGLIFMLLRGRDYATAKEDVLSLGWSDKLTDAIGKPLADVNDGLIPSGGYVLDSLRAALWCIENTNSFENAVLLGPVTYLFRSRCSFKPLCVRRRPGFSSPMLSAVDADCRSR